jgi:hypothetical protein
MARILTVLLLLLGYPRSRGRLSAPPGTPGYGSVFAVPALE